jgi:tRNA A-37 threonylcarbamoyl transferase component Bud32
VGAVCLKDRAHEGLPVKFMDEHRSERFGRYEILAELGRGAMGVVYKARDPKINRVVAVKTVSLSSQPPEEELEYRERFVREAEAAGRLSHPGIVTIFDVGEEPETRAPYIVMEFVNGPSLEKLLAGESHTLPLETALQLTLELAEALDCAHGQGVVHRDLKPANILITEDGHAKIADFGVAKLNLANFTLAGRALGTPAYMSPEQLRGDAVDGRSDLFSLGVVLYTVLTGYRPFQGNSAATVSFKVVNRDPVPASVLDTDLPPGLDYIIARAMAKDPSQRYQRGMEMVLDIQEMRAGREPWSKTKQQGAFAAVAAVQTATVRASAWATGQRAVGTKPGNRSSSLPLPPGRDGVEKLLQKMGKQPLAGTLLLAGVFAIGLQARHFIWPQKAPIQNLTRSTAAQTLPFAGEGASAKDATVVTPPGPDPAPRSIEPKLIANKLIANKPRATISVAPAPHATVSRATSPIVSPAMLDIEVEHKFAQAQLSIWVDGLLTYTHPLEGADKKRLVVFHKVEGHEFHAMQISPGKHTVRVRVESSENSYDQSDTVAGDFFSGKENMLRISFGKHGEMQVSLQ